MRKNFLILITFLCLSGVATAQSDYDKAIGIRLGSGYYDLFSGSYKVFITDPGALEFNLGLRGYGVIGVNWFNVSVAGSYQHHFPINAVPGLQWFVGGGAVVSNTFSSFDYRRGLGLGIFATGGADYKFSNIPLNVTVDIRPTFSVLEAYSYYNSFYPNGGIAARYTF